MQQSQWPAAVVAIAFLAFVAAIFLVVYNRDGIDAALKAWSAIGTVVGVLTGSIPAYFFHQSAESAKRDANALRLAADPATIERARTLGLRTDN